jgi:hypothetical protein
MWREGCCEERGGNMRRKTWLTKKNIVYQNAGNNIASGQFEQNVWPPVCPDPTRKQAEAHYGF